MANKLPLSTKDILNIELKFIEENNVNDEQIGDTIHFYLYYSRGLAVLVSIDNNENFKATKGRKYSILKGSYAKIMNNQVQLRLLHDGILVKTIVNGKEMYQFQKNSMPLAIGQIMLALTVSNSPSVNYSRSFVEDTRLKVNNKNTNHADEADQSILADGLSDAGFNIVVDKFINSITNEKVDIIELIADVISEKRVRDKHTYVYKQQYEGNSKLFDVYSNGIIEEALRILSTNRRLLIMGGTGDGKTSLAYLLAQKITGDKIAEPENAMIDTNYYRICVAGAGDGNTLWEVDNREENLGKLRLFVEHIEKMQISEPCVFICNEIQVSDLRYLIGSVLFEDFSKSKKCELLPDNLYLIFTGCTNSDFGIDEQITQRIAPIELNGLTEDNVDIKAKLLSEFSGDNCDKIINAVAKINSTEKNTVIPMRKLIHMLQGKKPSLGIKTSLLSSTSITILEELRGYYDN